MDSNLYKHLLTICLIPFAQAKYNVGYILHQDNDPKHTSGLLRSFYDEMDINWVTHSIKYKINFYCSIKFILKIKAPANSPDLNPIEMVWNQLKDYVRSKLCKNLQEIALAVNEFSINYPLKYCEDTINKLNKFKVNLLKPSCDCWRCIG